ncbi:MAG: hypothetical protein KJ077_07090 [Anaerolineae bacterium]|nr:hypothetical protein [Anaerolineae bacterium]
MPFRAITILYEPQRDSVLVSGAEGQWGDPLAGYQQLAEALRRHTAAEVSVQTGFLRDAPPGMVLVRSSGYEAMMEEIPTVERAVAAARTIILEADRSNVLALLERYSFAGAVEKHRWFAWRNKPDQESGGGLHGRRELAPAIGGSCFEAKSFQSEHYCILRSDRYVDLPALIVGYLEALGLD